MEKTPPGKSEKTYEQWLFDVKTIRSSYPEGLLKEAIFGSLKGSATDIARGLGPETTMDKVLELLDGVFVRKTNPDVLMQDFYKITQDAEEKVSNFGIRLKVALDRILAFHPESLTSEETAKKLKDRFYYGVRQNVREGLRYYYEVLQAHYTTLPTKARSIETEKFTSTTSHAVTMKSASTAEAGVTNQTSELSRQMNELIKIVKNQQVQNTKGGSRNSSNRFNAQDKFKDNTKGGRNLKGPDTNASGPFRNGAPPFQCYNCGGWGHRVFECPSPLNYQSGENPKRKKGTKSPLGKDHRVKQNKPEQNPKTSQKSIHDCYHNPDPIARLIGKRNESLVIVEGEEYLGLLDSGVQMLTITISQAKKMGLKIQKLENMLDIEGGGGIAIPYIGYVEVQLQIPEIKNYKENA